MTQFSKEEITDYIFIEHEPTSADIAIIFGTQRGYTEAASRAASLYKDGLVRKIVCTGYKPDEGGDVVEAEALYQELIRLEVNPADVMMEIKSTNTLENVLNARELIAENIGLEDIRVIVGVCKSAHLRRALMTMRRHFPSNVELRVATYIPNYKPISKDNWFETDEYRVRVYDEMRRIEQYLAKGDIAEI
ncbi:MAG TPA: YdcF family protein [Candidatus Paceibacterota bacterium]